MDLTNFNFSQKLNDISEIIKAEYELHFTKITKSANKGSFQSNPIEEQERMNVSRKGRKPK